MLECVCAVLDFECFQHKSLLFYREIGFAPIGDTKLINLHVKPGPVPPYTDRAVWKTFNTLKFKVHGLDLYPDDSEADNVVSQESVAGIIRTLHQYVSTRERNVIAFKGGNFERRLLQELNIPYLNLEDAGCVAYSILPREQKRCYRNLDCGQHLYTTNDIDHCPMKEVSYYRDWIMQMLEDQPPASVTTSTTECDCPHKRNDDDDDAPDCFVWAREQEEQAEEEEIQENDDVVAMRME
jgi:hypothetical protein